MATSSSAVTTASTVRVSERLVKHHMCPYGLNLLETACELFPCSHRVNLAAAKVLVGSSCPSPGCKNIIIGFKEDYYTREGVALLTSPEVIEMVKRIRQEALPPQELDYPGANGEFISKKLVWSEGNWKTSFKEGLTCRVLELRALDQEKSLIKRVEIRGWFAFTMDVTVYYNIEERDKFNKYLAAHSLGEIPEGNKDTYRSDGGKTKIFFKMFLKNNKIPEECSALLQRFTEVETWDLVKKYPAGNALFTLLESSVDVQVFTTTCESALVKSVKNERGKLTLTYNFLSPERVEYLDYFGFDGSSEIEGNRAIDTMIMILKKNNRFFGDFRLKT